MIVSIVALALLAAERLAELPLSQRNTKALMARGGAESGADHYPLMIALHVTWIVSLAVLAWNRPANLIWLAVCALLEAGRLWVILTLGPRWTTRIVTVPGEAPVRTGPYRFLAHPNYLIVAAEIAAWPLAFGLWVHAAVFSVLNAAMLVVRIRAENRALAEAYSEHPAVIPGRSPGDP